MISMQGVNVCIYVKFGQRYVKKTEKPTFNVLKSRFCWIKKMLKICFSFIRYNSKIFFTFAKYWQKTWQKKQNNRKK
jgi:hypothetical protein